MPNPVSRRQPQPPPESRDSAVLVDVLVLSDDLLLFDAIRGAIGERNPVWRARSAEESVDLLLTGRCGVLLVDMAAVSTMPATFVAQVVEQFPDVVVVVAGRREDEPLLAQLISDGFVYRFMHKPLTAKRAGMFMQAAIRHHVERRESSSITTLRQPAALVPGRFDPRKWLFVATGLAIFLGLLWMLGGDRTNSGADGPAPAATQAPPRVVPQSQPLADPVLSRARAAFAAGRFEAPAGRNALDLYAAVLLSKPGHAEARAGLDRTIDQVVGLATLAESGGNHAEAMRLLERAESADASNAAVRRLAAQLAPPPAPVPAAVPVALPTSAPKAAPVAPPTSAPGTVTAAVPTSAPKAVSASAAPRPVSRATGQSRPAPSIAKPAVVRRDPLTPRVVNADEMRTEALHANRKRTSRTYGSPISSGLPIAGIAGTQRADPPPEKPVSAIDPAAIAALAMPADELNRVYSTDPVYPPTALREHVEGWVELVFTITETGAVRDVEVVESEPRGVFDSAASEALGTWRFNPRLANGQPVAHRSTVTLRFNVDR